MLAPYKTVAMQYSPNNLIPYIGLVDAGTVELIRSFGKNIVSSANLVSQFEATLERRPGALALRGAGCHRCESPRGFKEIGPTRAQRRHHEYEMQQWVMEAFRREDIVTPDGR